ncbi:hypothetical protein FLL46_09280 [Aliikangiella coralliicola]|uniref:SRPBCC family protein n=2 Tax=Aliikangiella coralliicola TaxID=2592383 RepID=A0A545UFB6_9GAMM|nr:hypothetical protein FLL46_09280 [Aliikangiella coralliicola]
MVHYDIDKSALLYVGIPFFIALALSRLSPLKPNGSWKQKYLTHTISALIVMLGSSVVLFEGFLCVLMFMPIYFAAVLLGFTIEYLSHRFRNKKNSKLYSHALPVLIILSAFEGIHPDLSFSRDNQVSVTQVVNLSVSEIRSNLIKPMALEKERDWFLSLFPMPHQIKAGTLNEGDVHEIEVVYHRWFVTNSHAGKMLLKLEKVSDHHIKTRFLEDSSYLSTYMKLQGTEIRLTPIDSQTTQVTLSVSYERLLDPAWYFDPLQRYGVEKGAEFLIAEVIADNGEK